MQKLLTTVATATTPGHIGCRWTVVSTCRRSSGGGLSIGSAIRSRGVGGDGHAGEQQAGDKAFNDTRCSLEIMLCVVLHCLLL